jgi:hypothetical protein
MTTNLPFSEWTQVIPNSRLCKVLLDRVTGRGHIIETGERGISISTHAQEAEEEELRVRRGVPHWAAARGGFRLVLAQSAPPFGLRSPSLANRMPLASA